jgi:hypothetical protein
MFRAASKRRREKDHAKVRAFIQAGKAVKDRTDPALPVFPEQFGQATLVLRLLNPIRIGLFHRDLER